MQEQNTNNNTQKEIENIEKKYISIDDFLKIEIKLGTVISVDDVEGSDKLYKLIVDFGEYREVESEGGLIEKERHARCVFSGVKKMASKEDLLNKQFPFVTNLEPRKMMGGYSEAMILAASEEVTKINDEGVESKIEKIAFLNPSQNMTNGLKLK